MAAIKSNGLLKWGVPTIGALLVFVALFALKGTKEEHTVQNQFNDVIYNLTPEEQKELNLVAGDTPHDTLKTLLGMVKQTRADVAAVRSENEKLKQDNQNLQGNRDRLDKQIDDTIAARLENEVDNRLSYMQQEMERLQSALSEKNTQLTQSATSPTTELPIGLGDPNLSSANGGSIDPAGEINWISPSDISYVDKNGKPVSADDRNAIPSFSNLFKTLDNSPLGQASTKLHGKPNTYTDEAKPITPFYTIPENATLMGAVAMTALIGRIPVEGSVTDPFPFKILLGEENLLANGIQLPDIESAVVSGSASGDWTLSCVKGDVRSITFIFKDGRIQTLPQQQNNSGNGSIGWLSNPEGIPCIPGERKTNASEYLASQFLLSGASAAAQGLAQGQTTTVVDGSSVIGAVTGNNGQYVLGQALGGGLKETADWFKQRYGQMFDAVYVPPGKSVAVHITQSLNIDYDPNARKVNYTNTHSASALD